MDDCWCAETTPFSILCCSCCYRDEMDEKLLVYTIPFRSCGSCSIVLVVDLVVVVLVVVVVVTLIVVFLLLVVFLSHCCSCWSDDDNCYCFIIIIILLCPYTLLSDLN